MRCAMRGRALLWMLWGVLGWLACGSCTQEDMNGGEAAEAVVLLQVDADQAVTRATRANTSYGTEPFNSGVVLVFNENGVCEVVQKFAQKTNTTSFTVREGDKHFYVVGNASPELVNTLEAIHWEQDLLNATSNAADYNGGGKPAQGLLMTGKTEATVSSNSSNKKDTVTVPLTVVLAGVDFRIAKGGTDVGDIVFKSLQVHNARPVGYLYNKTSTHSATTTFTLSTPTTVSATGTEGTSVAMFYTYPVMETGTADLYFTLTVRHAGALADDVYTIYPNDDNAESGGVNFRPGYFNQVIVTFSRDETGNLTLTNYTTNGNDFEFGK